MLKLYVVKAERDKGRLSWRFSGVYAGFTEKLDVARVDDGRDLRDIGTKVEGVNASGCRR